MGVKMSKDKVEWSPEIVITGIPTMALLPPKKYYFKVFSDRHKIVIPTSGTYKEIDGEFFSEDDGSFTIKDGDTFNIATINRVLFANKSYPDLSSNQLFCPISVVVKDDVTTIYGQVVEMMQSK
jgi:hypothetical protein